MSSNCANFIVFLLCIIVFAVSSEITNDNSAGNCGPKETWAVFMKFAAEAIDNAKYSTVTLQDTDGNCGKKEDLISYLEVAHEMIKKAKVKFQTGYENILPQHKDMHCLSCRDCSDLLRIGHRRSGMYTIYPRIKVSEAKALDVYCDMETDRGGWTVIQRRGDFQNPVDYFYKDWKSYKEGFGDLEKEFWLGNDNIFTLTNQESYSARFDLVDYKGKPAYAHYDVFQIDDEDRNYTLHISRFFGDAGDPMSGCNNEKFSTRDRDNDKNKELHCAEEYKGGWWFYNCGNAHLNGENLKGKVQSRKGIYWYPFKGNEESLAKTEIKIRPKYLRF